MVTRAARVLGLAVAMSAPLVGCNAVLGIDSASLEPDGSSASDANANGDANTTESDPLTCENYCKVIAQNCTGEFLEYLPVPAGGSPSTDPCMDLCTNYLSRIPGTYDPPSGPEPPALTGQPGTLACRLWHAHAAGSTGHPEIHCRHAGPLGSTLCGDPCVAFCNLDLSYCSDDNNIQTYKSQADCESDCIDTSSGPSDAGFTYNQSVGDLTDDAGNQINAGNSLNCRLWHLETSIQEAKPDEHCWHTAYPSLNPPADGAGPTTGGPCTGP